MMTPITLEGSLVSLVPLTLAHLDGLCAVGLDPRLWQATTIQVSSRTEMEAYVGDAFETQKTGTSLPFVIVERGTDRIVGMTRYHSAAPQQKRIGIGPSWVSPAWQRSGVNTEAKYLLLRNAFEKLDCVRVEFLANVGNEQSRRALERRRKASSVLSHCSNGSRIRSDCIQYHRGRVAASSFESGDKAVQQSEVRLNS